MVQGHLTDDETALVINLDQIWLAICSRWKMIAAVTVIFALLGSSYSVFLCKDKYESTGTLLFNASDSTKIITNVDTGEQFLHGEGVDVNPYKSQTELLKSHLIAQRVFDALKKNKIPVAETNPALLFGSVLNAEQVKGTNLIRVVANAGTPRLAKRIADIYLDSYLVLINEISIAPLEHNKTMFKQQVMDAEKDLDVINQRINDYQKQYGILDIDVESQNQVTSLLNLENTSKSTEADLAEKRAEVARIRSQLKFKNKDIHSLLQSVASGQDSQLSTLQDRLQDAQKEYATKALIYAPTNPDMLDLQKRIDVLKRQITDQNILTVGHTGASKTGVIKDSVRTDMVNRLAAAESGVSALMNKLGTLHRQYTDMRHSLADLPQHELIYARLQLEKKSLEDILVRLKQNLTELQIQEVLMHKKLMVIDKPNLPVKPISMPHWQIIALASLAGMVLSVLSIATREVLTSQRGVRADFIEKMLGLPVLAMIPWLPDEQRRGLRGRAALEVTTTTVDPQVLKSYHNLALNLKVQRNQSQQNALVLSSVLEPGENSIIMANLAFCLAQSGERVLLIDANLRKPNLHTLFNHELDYDNGLLELINSISDRLYRKKDVYADEVLELIGAVATPSGLHPQLDYLNAGLVLENTFEFLNSKGFSSLIQASKIGYDWVLVDSPPFLEQPDGAVLLGYLDGLLLIVEKDAEESQITAVCNKVAKLHSTIPGVVLRKPV